MKPLTKKEILKRHQQNSKDKELQKDIEIKEIKRRGIIANFGIF